MSENGPYVEPPVHTPLMSAESDLWSRGSLRLRDLIERRIGPVARPVLGSLGMSRFKPIWGAAADRRHVQNCRLFATRDELLSIAPNGAACAEVGVETGYFSAQILERTRPHVLHLVDRNLSLLQRDKSSIRSALDVGVVKAPPGRFFGGAPNLRRRRARLDLYRRRPFIHRRAEGH